MDFRRPDKSVFQIATEKYRVALELLMSTKIVIKFSKKCSYRHQAQGAFYYNNNTATFSSCVFHAKTLPRIYRIGDEEKHAPVFGI